MINPLSPEQAKKKLEEWHQYRHQAAIDNLVSTVNSFLIAGTRKFKIRINDCYIINQLIIDEVVNLYLSTWKFVSVEHKRDFWHGDHYEWEFEE